MPIYGEETKEYGVSKGMWAGYAYPVPEGYVSSMQNLTINSQGNATARGSFTAMQAPNGPFQNNYGASARFPDKPAFCSRARTAYFNGTDTGQLAVYSAGPVSPVLYSSVRGAYPADIASYLPGGTNPPTSGRMLCLYRDRIYGVASGGVGLSRYTGWNFATAGPFVETAIAGSPTGGTDLFFFKDRLFLIDGNKVYFTDTLAVGGYPETWNTASNFFYLPSPTDVKITAYAVLNNMVYFFTSVGVYTLQVNGLPVNWIIKPLNTTRNVTYKDAVCVNNEVMYYYDHTHIYASNGYDEQVISFPIELELKQWDCVGIHPFGDGIVCTLQDLTIFQTTAGPPARYAYQVTATKLLLYSNGAWSELTFSDGSIMSVSSSANLVLSAARLPKNVTVVQMLKFSGASYTEHLVYYDKDSYIGDDLTLSGVELDIAPFIEFNIDMGSHVPHKRMKYSYLALYSEISSFFVRYFLQGTALLAEDNYNTSGVSDSNYFIKLKGSQYARRLAMRIRSVIPANGTYDFVPFEVKGISLVMNTSRNEPDHDEG